MNRFVTCLAIFGLLGVVACSGDSPSAPAVPTVVPQQWQFTNIVVDPQQQAAAEQRDQRCRLQLVLGFPDKAHDLPRRLASPAAHIARARVTKVRGVKLADAVIREPGALADRPGPRLVPNHSERELELAALGRIAVVGQSHINPFMLEKDHIQCYKTIYYPYMVVQ